MSLRWTVIYLSRVDLHTYVTWRLAGVTRVRTLSFNFRRVFLCHACFPRVFLLNGEFYLLSKLIQTTSKLNICFGVCTMRCCLYCEMEGKQPRSLNKIPKKGNGCLVLKSVVNRFAVVLVEIAFVAF